MKRILLLTPLLFAVHLVSAQTFTFGKGKLELKALSEQAVRVRYIEPWASAISPMPLGDKPLIYVSEDQRPICKAKAGKDGSITLATKSLSLVADPTSGRIVVKDASGNVVTSVLAQSLKPSTVQGELTGIANLTLDSPEGEYLYGLGQFQDGYSNVRNLTRRLTQVNTQISIPMFLSNKGYGLLWNNYGLVDFNPCDSYINLQQSSEVGNREVVNVTTTEGGRREERFSGSFQAELTVPEDGQYALMLDVGQSMARRHNLSIDGKNIIDVRNMWLPPTTSVIVDLKAGTHTITARLERGDHPKLFWRRTDATTTLRSPVAEAVDYTIFVGSPDEITHALHAVTGNSPLIPRWALGYIHCRERFHSQEEILNTANEFKKRNIPLDMLVQDWQYWGKYGWNAMQFDEQFYPNPRAMMDSLHAMNLRLMLSVWSRIDQKSEVGRQMTEAGYYIPQTQWIDFFNPDAANAYWKHFSQRLLPTGIDAWWQDATEPENDDLAGRRVGNGKIAGERVRNLYPLLVNRTVYEGSIHDRPQQRAMILTRCGFPGIQRYGAAMWSGDVGNDWVTLKRQIIAGLGMMAAGQPWWTYDAGGFFRPGDQYTNADYIQRMLRWIQTAVYLPLMRVHGYMSDTEPWRYGEEAEKTIANCIRERQRLLPYIYSCAAAVSEEGRMMMRPLVFDFASDAEALKQETEYMFGPSLLICPITEPNVTTCRVYLPPTKDGWTEWHTGNHYQGGQYINNIPVDKATIPVFARAGSIIPLAGDTLALFSGADADFILYEDDGVSHAFKQGKCSRITFHWNQDKQQLTIDRRRGSYEGMSVTRRFTIKEPYSNKTRTIDYNGKAVKLQY
ncbi:MAG: DUF5110 domain-containing protein [Bacteroidaceae bacterium]|nr:DUF5110 domain-containing protein [Bacteroidaceae bacterium]